MNEVIPMSKPYLGADDWQEVKKCLQSSWISSKSPWVGKFEQEFAQKISKTKYAVGVNSGTSALFLALKALGVGEGDEVIVPTFTMVASVNAIVWTGAKPVLVDSTSYDDWNMDVKEVESKINKRTKAILPVHVYGYPVVMDKVKKLAEEHKLFVVEDAAEAMGTEYMGKRCGSWGEVGCFSLYANKLITTGNGGMVVSNDKKIIGLVKRLAFFDFNEKEHFKHKLKGYNLVLSGLQASLGYAQVRKFDKVLAKRREVFKWYQEVLANNDKVSFVKPLKGSKPNFWFPAIIARSKEIKKKIMNALIERGVEVREMFRPIHLQPAYSDMFKNRRFVKAEYFYNHGLLLPSYFEITKKEVNFIGEIIKQI